MIVSCTCKNEFQDELYGKHMRVHSRIGTCKKGEKTEGGARYRCSVCLKENFYHK